MKVSGFSEAKNMNDASKLNVLMSTIDTKYIMHLSKFFWSIILPLSG